ncbi:MAG: hypothetical protein AMXMBFR23_03220 [Chloroflexota bacterium]
MPRFNAGRIYNDLGAFIGLASPGLTSDESLAALGLRVDPSAPGGVAPIHPVEAPPADTSALEERLAALEAAQAAAAAAGETQEAPRGE